MPSYSKYVDKNLYRSLGLRPKIFFDKETFGVDKLVVNPSPRGGGESEDAADPNRRNLLKQFLAEAPLADQAKRDLQRLYQEPKDYFPGLTSDREEGEAGAHELCQLSERCCRRSRRHRQVCTRLCRTDSSAWASMRSQRRTHGDSICPASMA